MRGVQLDAGLAPPFASSRLVTRELSTFARHCNCTRRIEERRAELHANLTRILVFDVRFLWWGIGNSLVRWLNLLRVGLASGRATFLWMEGRLPARGGKAPPRDNFDLGSYFQSLGADWRWNAKAEARVRAVHGPTAIPARLQYRALFGRDDRFIISAVGDSSKLGDGGSGFVGSTSLHGTRAAEHGGILLEYLSKRTEPWLVVDLRPKYMTAFEPSRRVAAAVLSGQIGTAWGAGWAQVCGVGHASGATTDSLDRFSQERYRVPPSTASENTTSRSVRTLTTRVNARCEAFALLRPRRALQRKLLPALSRLEGVNMIGNEVEVSPRASPRADRTQASIAVVGIHLRTGLADWQALATKNAAAAKAWQRATMAAVQRPLPFAKRWRRLESMLADCSGVPSEGVGHVHESGEVRATANELLARVRSGIPHAACFEWDGGAGPTLEDGLRCASTAVAKSASVRSVGHRVIYRNTSRYRGKRSGDWRSGERTNASLNFDAPSHGPLSALFACAQQFARSLSLQAHVGGWRLLILGDSPALIALASDHPQLGPSRIVHTAGTGALGHTAFGSASDVHADGADATLGDPRGAWTRSMADLYLAGVCDGFVSALFSSFPGAALLRSLLCCAGGRRRHFGASSSTIGSNRDHPMTNESFLTALL